MTKAENMVRNLLGKIRFITLSHEDSVHYARIALDGCSSHELAVARTQYGVKNNHELARAIVQAIQPVETGSE